jgi:DNA-binding response OmpR family regulator
MRKLSILVVEDNLAMQIALEELLTEAGHRVVVSECSEALQELSLGQIDLVLLDINLPGEDGLSLAKRLRKSYPRLGIIMISARNTSSDKVIGYQSGADIYFAKPFDPEELIAAMLALVERLNPQNHQTMLVVDVATSTLLYVSATQSLTANEVKLLQQFCLAPSHTLETWQIQELLALETGDVKHQVELIISRLRKKFVNLGIQDQSIKSLRLFGYQLCFPMLIV